jgi:histidinol dehydrogenase
MIQVVQASEFSLKREETDVYEKERAATQEILAAVRADGDEAVRAFTKKFDGVELSDFRIPEEMFAKAYAEVSDEFLEALRHAIANIRRYHEASVVDAA